MDVDAKKDALRTLVYGVYVLGAKATTPDGDVSLATVSWATQLSFEPPILGVALEVESRTLAAVRATRSFAISVLPVEAKAVASRLGRASVDVPDKSVGMELMQGAALGAPVLRDAIAWLECRLTSELACGDHVLLVGDVADAGMVRSGTTLTLGETGWKYSG